MVLQGQGSLLCFHLLLPIEHIEPLGSSQDSLSVHNQGGFPARELCNRVRKNRNMKGSDKSVGYVIAREPLRDEFPRIPYCTEAVVALTMQSHLGSTTSEHEKEDITAVIVDEVRNRSHKAILS